MGGALRIEVDYGPRGRSFEDRPYSEGEAVAAIAAGDLHGAVARVLDGESDVSTRIAARVLAEARSTDELSPIALTFCAENGCDVAHAEDEERAEASAWRRQLVSTRHPGV
jgi:hypothetical protein